MTPTQAQAGDRRGRAARSATVVLILSFACASTGCSFDRYYAETERALDTSSYFHALDHIAVYYPSGISLNFPGYIIGFEETERRRVSNAKDDVLFDNSVRDAGYTVHRLLKTLRFHLPIVSHVLRYEGNPFGEGNCALYNLYHNDGRGIIDYCDGGPQPARPGREVYESAFVRSWDAIDLFKARINDDVNSGEYTHLVVGIMGLDTAQEEAIRNYNSIVWSIRRNGKDTFKPLFVGVTWPSFFANRWLDPLWEAFAYTPIADRADILGLSWLAIVLNDVILPVSSKIRVTVIAHSFGARAASMSLCVGSGIRRGENQTVAETSDGKVDDFIGLSSAFSLQRFNAEERFFYENVFYADYCPKIRRFVFTASRHDGAYEPVIWSDMVGDHQYRERFCRRSHPVSVSCVLSSNDGHIQGYDPAAEITYVDTSALMRYNVPGTEGKAHSDIYRPEIGRLIWTVINGPEE